MLKKALFAALGLFALGLAADAQNLSAPANPDTMFCTTRGAIATRLATRWQCLTPGTSGQVLKTNGPGADAGWLTVTGTGTVTSVDMTVPASLLAVSGNPVTTSGTLAITTPNQLTNLVFASPNGSTGAPTFRALAGADVPAINLAASGAGGVTGVLPLANLPTITVAKGGTNATSASGTALDNITGFASTGIVRRTGAGTYTQGTLITVAEGGTNSASASGTALDNITGFSTTGVMQRTGAGTYTFNTIPAILGSQTANFIYAAPSGSAGNPVFRAMTATDIPSSVALAGSPTTTTQAALDNSTKIATTAYVDAAVSTLPGGPTFIGKTADQIVSSSTTFVSDNSLTFSMAAATRYYIHVNGLFSNSNAAGGFKIGYQLSATVTSSNGACIGGGLASNGLASGGSSTTGTGAQTLFNAATTSANTPANVSCDFAVENITGGTTFTVVFAENSAANSVTLLKGSNLSYKTY